MLPPILRASRTREEWSRTDDIDKPRWRWEER